MGHFGNVMWGMLGALSEVTDQWSREEEMRRREQEERERGCKRKIMGFVILCIIVFACLFIFGN